MVNHADAIAVLYPNINMVRDFVLTDEGNGPFISYWSESLGPQPTAEQLAAVTQEQVDAAKLAMVRLAAKSLLDNVNDNSVERDKAIAFATLDGINQLRDWLVQFKAATAAAGSLAALKTSVAELPNMPEITPQQMFNAVKSKLD